MAVLSHLREEMSRVDKTRSGVALVHEKMLEDRYLRGSVTVTERAEGGGSTIQL